MTLRLPEGEVPVGIRPADLTAEERGDLADLRSWHVPTVRAEREARALAEGIAELPDLEGPSLQRARAHRARRVPPGRSWRGPGIALIAAAALGVVLLPGWLGAGAYPEDAVRLAAATEGERVHLTVTSRAPGYLLLVREGSGLLLPEPAWIDPGVHRLGPDEGLPFERDLRGDAPTYHVLLCRDPADVRSALDRCAVHVIEVT